MPLVTIPQGKIGYVFARDGEPLAPTRRSAPTSPRTVGLPGRRAPSCAAAARRARSGRSCARAPTRSTWRSSSSSPTSASTACRSSGRSAACSTTCSRPIAERGGFTPGRASAAMTTSSASSPSTTARRCRRARSSRPTVGDDPRDDATYHNNFQDPEKFLARRRPARPAAPGARRRHLLHQPPVRDRRAGPEDGRRGRQRRRRRLLHRRARRRPLGRAVPPRRARATGERGVWSEPLLPGKYAFNTYAGKVDHGPDDQLHPELDPRRDRRAQLDENLSEVSLITKDAFEPTLPLSVVVHIDYRRRRSSSSASATSRSWSSRRSTRWSAPTSRTSRQTRTLIQLLQDRAQIQDQSASEMKAKFDAL